MITKKQAIRFAIHIGLMLLVLTVVLNIVIFILKNFTNHGEQVDVPSLIEMKVDEVPNFLEDKPFEYTIMDSVFDNRYPKGTVVDQDPKPGTKVKKNRKLYLTINALSVKLVKIPELNDVSLVQAKATLLSSGLSVGGVSEEHADCDGCIVRFMYKSVSKRAGDRVPEQAKIDLVVGRMGGGYKSEDTASTSINQLEE